MIRARDAAPAGGCDTGLAVDHIGVVVHDLAAEIAAWRGLGFSVSHPVPLIGSDAAGRPVPLGQSSAHVVFENGYVELSSPLAGVGNHLEPYLARGEGVRILVLAAADAAATRAAIATRWSETSPVKASSRAIHVEGQDLVARFRWFPLPFEVIPGVLSAVVQHLTPELVFHPSLVAHGNGLRRIAGIVATGRPADIYRTFDLGGTGRPVPSIHLVESEKALAVDGLRLAGLSGGDEKFFSLA